MSTKPIMLDATPLGKLAHPRPHQDIIAWIRGLVATNREIIIPEIADYEIRRELLLRGSTKGIERLNELRSTATFMPITTPVMLHAAELWAQARKRGRPTADSKSLDGDVILAAQALSVGAVIATENIRHLDQFVEARLWRDLN